MGPRYVAYVCAEMGEKHNSFRNLRGVEALRGVSKGHTVVCMMACGITHVMVATSMRFYGVVAEAEHCCCCCAIFVVKNTISLPLIELNQASSYIIKPLIVVT